MHQRHSATLTTRHGDGPDDKQPESDKTKAASLSDASLSPGSSLLPVSYNETMTKKTWKRRRMQRNGGSTACCPAPRKRLHHGTKNQATRYDPVKVFGCIAILSLVVLWIHSQKSRASREDQQEHRTHWTDAMIQAKRDKLSILREELDSRLENTPVRHRYNFEPIRVDGDDVVPYDVFNCPEEPPQGYPYAWKILDILDAWPPDDPTPRAEIHQGLCVFDYQTEKEKAYTYRDANLPFVVQNDPRVLRTARRWNDLEYMNEMMGLEEKWGVHYSESNHFMFWRNDTHSRAANSVFSEVVKRKFQDGWNSPTQKLKMTFQEWTEKALSLPEASTISSGIPMPHWYLMLNSNDCNTKPRGEKEEPSKMDAICRRGTFLDDELPFLNQSQTSLYIVEANKTNTPIECRFGMRDVIAENHFDMTRNTIALLSGERRYILNHPNQCKLLSLYPRGHPSARHSAVNWSNPDLDSFPKFQRARANEVVLQAGDVLYLPTNWFHYIVSLSKNYQCNARSGWGREYERDVKRCGFSRPRRLGGMEK